jgi:hypothetical protein
MTRIMTRITTRAQAFSYCDQSHAGCDQQHLGRFVWPSEPVEATP